MKKLTKYLSLILAVILSLTSLSGAVAEEIGDQITFAYYVNDNKLYQIGMEGESTRPATKIVAQLDQATAYYWVAPAEGETAGSLYVDSLLSSNSEPTLLSDSVYGEPVYVKKDSKIYFLDANDSRLLKAVAISPYLLATTVSDVATLPFADTALSDSLEGLHVEREIAAGLYVNRVFDTASGTLVSSTLDPEAEYHLFSAFETQQKDGSGLQLRTESGETWRLLTDQLADCQAAYDRDLYYGVYDETSGQTTLYQYNVDTMQTATVAVVPGTIERMAAYGTVVALLSKGGVLRLVDTATGTVTDRGDYAQVTLPNDTAPVSQFDLALAGNYVLVYGVRADNGLSEIIEMVELPAVNPTVEPLPTATVLPTVTATPVPTVAPTATPNPYATLQNGSRGEAVTKLQNRLNELGYSCGKADGVFGERTRLAVLYFQDQTGLRQDGVAGAAVQKKLYAADAPEYVKYIEKSRGDTGIRVQDLQARLRELGYLADAADGEFGRRTQDAVKLFQEECGLRVTGKATVATLRELFASDAPICSSYITLQRGDSGKRVSELNKRLVELGYLTRESSRYSKDTEQAVQWFQSVNGLTVSGVADTATLKAVFASGAIVAPTASPTPEPTATPAPTATVEPTAVPTTEPTAEPEPTATAEPEPTATAEPEPTAIPEPTATAEPEPTATADPEPTATAEPEPTATAEPEPTATAEPEPTATAEPEPTATPAPQLAVTKEQLKVLVDLLNKQYPADPATYTTDNAAKWLQQQLVKLTYLSKDFTVNSVYDQTTRDAVKALQKAKLEDTSAYTDETWGVVDEATFTKIVELIDKLG